MAPRWLRQMQLLLWKNFILQIRRPIGTTFEIIIPVLFSSILILAKIGLKGTSGDYCFVTFRPDNDYLYSTKYIVYPNTSWVSNIINGSSKLQKMLVSEDQYGNPFESEEAAASAAANFPQKYGGAIIFQNVKLEELPKAVSYKIRLKTYDAADTSRVYPQFQVPGPRDYSAYKFSFVVLQKEVDRAITRLQTQQDNLLAVDKKTQFPFPEYRLDPFIQIVQVLLPIIFVIAFIYTAVCIIREIIREKREGLKEAMKMMGLANWVHWLCWFIKNLIFLAISCVLLTIMLKVAKIFEYTDGSLLFVFFICYSFSFVSFCFAISVFSCNVICGMLVGAIFWILSYVPYAVITGGTNNRYDIMTTVEKAAACLLPNTCLGIGIQVISKFEVSQIGGQWDNISTVPSIDENFNLLLVILMFFVQSIVWWIITWYVEAIFPGQYGVPKPFYFFLTTSYWCGTTKCCSTDSKLGNLEQAAFVGNTEDVSDVEPAPQGSEVGVNICGLKKVFKTSTGKRVAVDGLNLKIYKGQITALLGHNGAGKTTTISILTGLYTPTKGNATINGRDIRTDMDRIRESLGLCPQHNVLFDRLTVQEHLEFFIGLKGISGTKAKSRIDEMLMDIQLQDKSNARSTTLSGGMKRKLCCAIALIGDPDIVFLDEPTSGMDPYARRATWNLLEKYAERTTIILTTHFMDEADYLGDRIAIMTNGQLRCCGTSLYLKKKYGVGYRMTLVKKPQLFDDIKVSKQIEGVLPSAKLDSDTSTERSYVLEHQTSRKFRDLFEKLEEHKDELGIQSFGVSITTLEEVFLKVGEETAAADNTKALLSGDEIVACSEKEKLTGMALRLAQFKAMFTKRFTNSKREKKAIFTQLLLPLVIIIGGLALTKVTSLPAQHPPLTLDLSMLSKSGENTYAYVADYRTNQSTDWKKWEKYMTNYFGSVRVSPRIVTSETLKIRQMNSGDLMSANGKTYNLSITGNRSCCNYKYLVLNSKCQHALNTKGKFQNLCGTNDKTFGYAACTKCIEGSWSNYDKCPMPIGSTKLADPSTIYNEYVLEQSNSKRFFNKYVAGITFKNDENKGPGFFKIDGWYSNQALHTLPSVINAIDNIILKFLKDSDEYAIKVINHPLPLTRKEKDNEDANSAGSIVMSIFATLTASFISASFVVFIISEKKSKAKHIQFISGVNGTIYWVATFCWDFINYLIPAVLIMISFAAFQDSFIKGEDLAALCFVIFLFGFGVLPFTYVLSCIFTSPFVAYAVIAIFGFGISVAMFFAVFICRFQGSSCTDAALIMHKFFLLIPMYGFSSSIIDIKQNVDNRAFCTKPNNIQTCKRRGTLWHESSLAFDYPGVGMTCLYFIVQFFVFLSLIILIEENFFIALKPKPPPPRPIQSHEDDDVKIEKERVANMTSDGIMEAAVVIKDLTKIYRTNNITAVDALSVAIPKGQCFGLLGVNGAGKTTTFSMLTGELGITGGTAYLSGVNIQQHLREVQKKIGYCPQFDALLDHLTGREMLEMFARLRGIPSYLIPDVVNTVLYQLNLNKYADKMCGTYSGGNKRKLSTALAMVGDPPVLFLDEPTSGMDPVSRRFLWNALTSILESNDRSIILTSHSMEECEALCNRLVIMVNGEFKCIGSLQHLKTRFGQGYMLSIKVGGRDKATERASFRRRVRTASTGENAGIVLNEIEAEAETEAEPQQIEDASIIEDRTQKVKQFIERHFPNSYLIEERPGMLQYQVVNPELKWSYMFGTLEDNAANMNITDYSLSQTTLEQVFVNFARFQRPEINRKKRCCCCSC